MKKREEREKEREDERKRAKKENMRENEKASEIENEFKAVGMVLTFCHSTQQLPCWIWNLYDLQ